MEALPGQIAAIAAANVVKTASAADNVSMSDPMDQGGDATSSVLKNLIGACKRSANVTFDKQVESKTYVPQ